MQAIVNDKESILLFKVFGLYPPSFKVLGVKNLKILQALCICSNFLFYGNLDNEIEINYDGASYYRRQNLLLKKKLKVT